MYLFEILNYTLRIGNLSSPITPFSSSPWVNGRVFHSSKISSCSPILQYLHIVIAEGVNSSWLGIKCKCWSVLLHLRLLKHMQSIGASFKTWLYTNQFHNFPHNCYHRELNFIVTCFLTLFYFFLFSLSVSWERNNTCNLLFPPVILVSRWFPPTNLLFSCTWKQLVSLQSTVNFNV